MGTTSFLRFFHAIACTIGAHAYRSPTDRELIDYVAQRHKQNLLMREQAVALTVCRHCGRLFDFDVRI